MRPCLCQVYVNLLSTGLVLTLGQKFIKEINAKHVFKEIRYINNSYRNMQWEKGDTWKESHLPSPPTCWKQDPVPSLPPHSRSSWRLDPFPGLISMFCQRTKMDLRKRIERYKLVCQPNCDYTLQSVQLTSSHTSSFTNNIWLGYREISDFSQRQVKWQAYNNASKCHENDPQFLNNVNRLLW